MTDPQTKILAQLVCAKHQCLLQLRDLGRRQLDLIEAADMTGLLEVLSTKQHSISQLQRIEKALNPFRDQDPDRRQWNSSEDRQCCAEQLKQCETLFAEIVSQEKCSEGELIRRRDEAATRLQGAHLGGQVRGAYTTQPTPHVNQLDLDSQLPIDLHSQSPLDLSQGT